MTTIPGPRRRSPAPSDSSRQLPAISTSVGRVLANDALSASDTPLITTTPDALNFYRSAADGNNFDSTSASPSTYRPSDTLSSRSASGPLPGSAPRPVKSIPSLPSQKRSVKDIAAQFNQVNSTQAPPPLRNEALRSSSLPAHRFAQGAQPAASMTTPALPSTTALPQRNKLQKPPHQRRKSMEEGKKRLSKLLGVPPSPPPVPVRPSLSRNLSSQQYLFGEVAGVTSDSRNIGLGIPRQMPRRGSEGSMRRPNPLFPRPSNLDLSATISPDIPQGPYTVDHHRSRSDMTETDHVHAARALQSFQNGLPQGPLRARDEQYTNELHRPPHLLTLPTGTSVKDRRPVTPPANLSFPQLASEPGRHLTGEQPRLKAYIKDSPTKTSPPLRSSRPRQQVSSYAQHTNEQPDSQFKSTSALQELSNAIYQNPRSVPRLEVDTSKQGNFMAHGPDTPRSATGTDGGTTDFEVDTPPGSAGLNEHAITETLGHSRTSGRAGPLLAVDTQISRPKGSLPNLHGPGDSPTLPDDSNDTGMIQIMLGDRSLLTPQTGTAPPMGLASRVTSPGSPRENGALFTPLNPGSGDNQRAYSYLSSNPTTPGRLTIDSSGYNAISNILSHYEEGGSVSPQMIESLGSHVLHAASDISPQDAVAEMLRDIDFSRQDSTRQTDVSDPPYNLSLRLPSQHKEHTRESATVAHSTASHETDIEDNGSSIHEEQGIYGDEIRSRASSTIPEGSKRHVDGSQRSSMNTSTTTMNEQPALPKILDTGGALDVPETSRISILPQFPEFVPEELSPVQSSAPHSHLLFDRYQSMAGQQMSSPELKRHSTTSSQAQLSTSERATPTEQESASSIHTSDQKRLVKRQNIINELINTEFVFHRDMTVVEDIYMGTANSCSDLTDEDIRTLFSNTPAIANFSRCFADTLKENCRGVYQKPAKDKRPQLPQSKLMDVDERPVSMATTNSGNTDLVDGTDEDRDRKTRVGSVFMDNMSNMEKVYAEYLKNHESANRRLISLQQQDRVKLWMSECEAYAKDLSNAWNLDAMLVKPTQRLLKYPLLLDDLVKTTPKDHPDFTAVEMAAKELRDMSHRINEAKKRAELLERVVNSGKSSDRRDISERLGNLMKGRTEKVKQGVGTLEHVEDPDYVALSQKFGSQHLQLQVVMKDMEKHRENGDNVVKKLIDLADGWSGIVDVGATPSPELESKWRRWAQAIRELTIFAWADHVIAVERHCIQPIKTCLSLYDRPQNLIKERKKRLPQYASFRSRKESNATIKDELQGQAEQFMALNESLKDELPQLYSLSAKLVGEALKNWIHLNAQWNSIAQRKLHLIVEDRTIPEWSKIVDTFNSDHQYGITDITSLGICNGSLQNDTSNFLASSANSVSEDGRVSKRPSYGDNARRGPSFENTFDWRQASSEQQRGSGSSNPRPSTDSGQHGWQGSHQRLRSHSGSNTPRGHTSHGPRPPLPTQQQQPNGTFFLQRTPPLSTSHAASYEAAGRLYANYAPQSSYNQHAATMYRNDASHHHHHHHHQQQQQPAGYYAGRPSASDTTLVSPSNTSIASTIVTQNLAPRTNNVFSSAMPMSDAHGGYATAPPHRTHSGSRGQDGHMEGQRPAILWLAASLFDFKLDTTRREAGYPYLTYDPGEIFDVIGARGELWLARNQDDPNGPVGWIWEKHFAKLINEDP